LVAVKFDVLVVAALPLEIDALARHLGSPVRGSVHDRFAYRCRLETETGPLAIAIVDLGGMGGVAAAATTTAAIGEYDPEFVILAGIAAGVAAPERALGDVLVAEQVVYYELAKITPGETKRRYQVLRPAHRLLRLARSIREQDWIGEITQPRPEPGQPRVHFGVVAAGEKVVADDALVAELQSDWSRLAGVEMESYGVAYADYASGRVPGFFLAKGISDWADPSKNDDWQPYAADASAAFVKALLLRAGPKVSLERSDAPPPQGTAKIELCRRLGADWEDLADLFYIPPYQRQTFRHGKECQDIWAWLQNRELLHLLPQALRSIGRPDLQEIFKNVQL
jgi:nucleoside phosphorylase